MPQSLRTVLIHTPCYELQDDRLEPPLGLLYIATWLNCHGFITQIVDLSSTAAPNWMSQIPPADVYGFSTYTPTYHRTLDIKAQLHQIYPGARFVAGGPHATALPTAVSRDFDHVVVGEGEASMLMLLLLLLRTLARGSTPPPTLTAPLIEDLDTLPYSDYALVDVPSYHRIVDGNPSLSILSSRGCPHQCVFCNSLVMGRAQKVRYRSARHVVGEIVALKEQRRINAFRFQDDTFTLNRPRLREIARLLKPQGITYRCFGRVGQCTSEITDLLYASGCRHISFGVESGSPRLLARMVKHQAVEQIRRGIGNAKASGLAVRVFLLVGFPGETWQTIQETIDLMLDLRPDEYSVYPVIPYPGTPLYNDPTKFGITRIDTDFSRYFQVARGRTTGYVFRTDALSEMDIAAMREILIARLAPVIQWAGDSTRNR